jgi:hypothetical protein
MWNCQVLYISKFVESSLLQLWNYDSPVSTIVNVSPIQKAILTGISRKKHKTRSQLCKLYSPISTASSIHGVSILRNFQHSQTGHFPCPVFQYGIDQLISKSGRNELDLKIKRSALMTFTRSCLEMTTFVIECDEGSAMKKSFKATIHNLLTPFTSRRSSFL